MSRRPFDRIPVVAVGVALTAAACARVGDPGVEIQSLQAEIAFGVEIPEEESPALTPVVPAGEGASFDDGSVVVPFRNRVADRFRSVPFRVEAPAVTDCPSAGIGASPATLASEDVGPDDPREGVYRWKRELVLTTVVNGTEVVSRSSGFETRLVRNVEVVGEGTDPTTDDPGRQIVYEVVRPDGFGGVIGESYRVNTDPISRGANVSQDVRGVTFTAEGTAEGAGVPLDIPDPVQEALPNQFRPRVGEPNRGLTLTARVTYDGNGVEIGAFDPVPPALLLPLPVDTGDVWTSTSVSTTGQILRVGGEVSEREAVDACGTMLDGWRADLDVVEAGGTTVPVQRTEELIVSTQYGGLIIGQHIIESGTDAAGNAVTLEATYSIAQVDPGPLPAGSEG